MNSLLDRLNEAQCDAVKWTEGPLLVMAGPGSGKTLTLVRRTMHILSEGLAEPSEIVLCTYTEKAALELRDRVRMAAQEFGFSGDLTGLRVGTIHGIANDFIEKFRHSTDLAANYEVLDELTQTLFVFEHFQDIVPPARDGLFFGRWKSKWAAIKLLINFLNKITEELVDTDSMVRDPDLFVQELAAAHQNYQRLLIENNKIDFAHLQAVFLDLLASNQPGDQIRNGIKYVMVDEYQDTNYIQEQIVRSLASQYGNLCVVGDEDQSLYRFRGATVRNILEFESQHPNCRTIQLTTNYRSHEQIVAAYNGYMAGHDWSNSQGANFRFAKTIEPATPGAYPDYPAVLTIREESKEAEAEAFAELVEFLKVRGTIQDYSQVALLLYSVRDKHSRPFVDALAKRGISSFCPRARAYFTNTEVRTLVACHAIVLGFEADDSEARGALAALTSYVRECVDELIALFPAPHPLISALKKLGREISSLSESQTSDRRVADFIYELLGTQPFTSWAQDENKMRNLATFSQLTDIFHRYYGYPIISGRNLPSLRRNFFNSFLRFLYDGGINEYEDKDQPFPKGHVQIMTIHQSKGLEFPVVAVGSLDHAGKTEKLIEETLGKFYKRQAFEPLDRIRDFDNMRLHYVAFSRPEKMLVLTHGERKSPQTRFSDVFKAATAWPGAKPRLEIDVEWPHVPKSPPSKSYSFTSDLTAYETCARQYQMFRHYEFAPARTAMVFFGLLVHQTIEDIHRKYLDEQSDEVDKRFIETRFEFNYGHLARQQKRQIAPAQKQAALEQVLRYWEQSSDLITRVVETEVDVSLQKDGYILEGAIDLVLSDSSSLDVLDFKAQQRPPADHPVIDSYYRQLCIYAHILEQRHGRQPDRLIIYWTAEKTRDSAMMVFPFNRDDVEAAAEHFDAVVRAIENEEFAITRVPEAKVCAECDVRPLCYADGTLT